MLIVVIASPATTPTHQCDLEGRAGVKTVHILNKPGQCVSSHTGVVTGQKMVHKEVMGGPRDLPAGNTAATSFF